MDFVRYLLATQEAEKAAILWRVLGLKPAAPTLADRQLAEQRRQAQAVAAQALQSLGVDHDKPG